MSSSPQPQAPSPGIVFDTLQAYQRSVALRGAIDLDLFTAIADGNKSVSAIAARVKASEKGTRVLCDYLTMIGFLVKDGGEYSLTPDSAAFLSRHSPGYMGTMARFLMNPEIAGLLEDITSVVRHGGAGHGLYGIAFAKHNPNAKVTGVDWANVLEVAKENATKADVSDRYSTIAGSAFDVDFGSDYDIVLIPNFLHHFDVATNEKLLRKVHAALAPQGTVITPEFIPNEDRISPPRDAMFSMQMLSTPAGDAYTFSELEEMFRNAGFTRNEMRELSPFPQRLVVSQK